MRERVFRSMLLAGVLSTASVFFTASVYFTASVWGAPVQTASPEAPFPSADAPRILFLGDSITFAGHYVATVEAHLRTARPDIPWRIVNIGLPSETCTGLSEPDHPFPRPNVHERLARALDKFQPDLVVACYGMNDGIYYPFGEDRFTAYQRGIQKIIDTVRESDTPLVLMTPPPFDPLPLRSKGKLRGKTADKFAWFAIYEDYDQVMTRYARWIMSRKDDVRMVVDLHTPVRRFVDARRADDADFTMSPDGVHLNRQGHDVIAKAILTAWGYDGQAKIDGRLLKLVEQRELLLRDAWLSHIGHKRPGVKKGKPLKEARAEARKLDQQIEALQ